MQKGYQPSCSSFATNKGTNFKRYAATRLVLHCVTNKRSAASIDSSNRSGIFLFYEQESSQSKERDKTNVSSYHSRGKKFVLCGKLF